MLSVFHVKRYCFTQSAQRGKGAKKCSILFSSSALGKALFNLLRLFLAGIFFFLVGKYFYLGVLQ